MVNNGAGQVRLMKETDAQYGANKMQWKVRSSTRLYEVEPEEDKISSRERRVRGKSFGKCLPGVKSECCRENFY